jgi:hypothetical protein
VDEFKSSNLKEYDLESAPKRGLTIILEGTSGKSAEEDALYAGIVQRQPSTYF